MNNKQFLNDDFLIEDDNSLSNFDYIFSYHCNRSKYLISNYSFLNNSLLFNYTTYDSFGEIRSILEFCILAHRKTSDSEFKDLILIDTTNQRIYTSYFNKLKEFILDNLAHKYRLLLNNSTDNYSEGNSNEINSKQEISNAIILKLLFELLLRDKIKISIPEIIEDNSNKINLTLDINNNSNKRINIELNYDLLLHKTYNYSIPNINNNSNNIKINISNSIADIMTFNINRINSEDSEAEQQTSDSFDINHLSHEDYERIFIDEFNINNSTNDYMYDVNELVIKSSEENVCCNNIIQENIKQEEFLSNSNQESYFKINDYVNNDTGDNNINSNNNNYNSKKKDCNDENLNSNINSNFKNEIDKLLEKFRNNNKTKTKKSNPLKSDLLNRKLLKAKIKERSNYNKEFLLQCNNNTEAYKKNNSNRNIIINNYHNINNYNHSNINNTNYTNSNTNSISDDTQNTTNYIGNCITKNKPKYECRKHNRDQTIDRVKARNLFKEGDIKQAMQIYKENLFKQTKQNNYIYYLKEIEIIKNKIDYDNLSTNISNNIYIEQYKELLNNIPYEALNKNPIVYLKLAYEYLQLNEYERALEFFIKANNNFTGYNGIMKISKNEVDYLICLCFYQKYYSSKSNDLISYDNEDDIKNIENSDSCFYLCEELCYILINRIEMSIINSIEEINDYEVSRYNNFSTNCLSFNINSLSVSNFSLHNNEFADSNNNNINTTDSNNRNMNRIFNGKVPDINNLRNYNMYLNNSFCLIFIKNYQNHLGINQEYCDSYVDSRNRKIVLKESKEKEMNENKLNPIVIQKIEDLKGAYQENYDYKAINSITDDEDYNSIDFNRNNKDLKLKEDEIDNENNLNSMKESKKSNSKSNNNNSNYNLDFPSKHIYLLYTKYLLINLYKSKLKKLNETHLLNTFNSVNLNDSDSESDVELFRHKQELEKSIEQLYQDIRKLSKNNSSCLYFREDPYINLEKDFKECSSHKRKKNIITIVTNSFKTSIINEADDFLRKRE